MRADDETFVLRRIAAIVVEVDVGVQVGVVTGAGQPTTNPQFTASEVEVGPRARPGIRAFEADPGTARVLRDAAPSVVRQPGVDVREHREVRPICGCGFDDERDVERVLIAVRARHRVEAGAPRTRDGDGERGAPSATGVARGYWGRIATRRRSRATSRRRSRRCRMSMRHA